MAVNAGEIAELADIDLKHANTAGPQRSQAGIGESLLEGLHMLTFAAQFRICNPCTSDAPPRMAEATCSASVIWSSQELYPLATQHDQHTIGPVCAMNKAFSNSEL